MIHAGEKQTLQGLEESGLRDLQYETSGEGRVVALRFLPRSATDRVMGLIGELEQLSELDLSGSQVTDAGLAEIAGLSELKILGLPPAATDVGLAKLRGITGLEELYVGQTQITGAGFERFNFEALTTLNAARSPLTDRALAALKTASKLTRLILRETRVTDDGLAHLAHLASLTYLDLRATVVGDAGLPHLADLKELQHLDLSYTSQKITDAGVAHLAGLANLRSLWLSGSEVTDACIDSLSAMEWLNEISLWKTQVTDNVFNKLKSLDCFEHKRLYKFHIRSPNVTDEALAKFRKTLAAIHKSKHRLNP